MQSDVRLTWLDASMSATDDQPISMSMIAAVHFQLLL